ncbi:MAG TPA: AMP-binding protein, partial [Gemmataceae bacterium]|nr:AMP-binding protein [Gemmataceae bacterium]
MTNAEPPWVDGLTFAEVLANTVDRFGDHDALVFPWLHCRRSYRDFHTDVQGMARGLLALDVERGEHVGIWATNWPQWVITQFAAGSIGAVLVNINPAYRAHELQYVLNQADITTLLLTDQFKSSHYFDLLVAVCPELAACRPAEL